MIFHDTPLEGARLIELQKRGDDRGFFARAWCRRELEEAGLETGIAQANLSGTRYRGTVRGLHYQMPPAAEDKLVRCTRGAIWDVILDLRPESPTYRQWHGFELTEDNHRTLFVPKGFAHGFQTLTDDVETFYFVSAFYSPEDERGVRFDDPAFGIDWPLEITVISDKDAAWPDFTPDAAVRLDDGRSTLRTAETP